MSLIFNRKQFLLLCTAQWPMEDAVCMAVPVPDRAPPKG
jgi:hypothetical protein